MNIDLQFLVPPQSMTCWWGVEDPCQSHHHPLSIHEDQVHKVHYLVIHLAELNNWIILPLLVEKWHYRAVGFEWE